MKNDLCGVVNPRWRRGICTNWPITLRTLSVESGSGGRQGQKPSPLWTQCRHPRKALGRRRSPISTIGCRRGSLLSHNPCRFKLTATTIARLQVIANLDKHDSSQPRRGRLVLSTKTVANRSVAGNSMLQFFLVFAQPRNASARGSSPLKTRLKSAVASRRLRPRHGQAPTVIVHTEMC